ncbi:MAG: WD40 repeat domain-containing protein, partial [Cyanobacteria bacterium J06607_6]
DKRRTAFNIGGQFIDLQGFQLQEGAPLAQGLAAIAANPQAVLQAVLYWTGGQPFLTQWVCHLLQEARSHIESDREAEQVAQMVQSRIIANWEVQDSLSHLKTIRDRLLSNQQRTGRILSLYQRILEEGAIAADGSPEQIELRLSGLVTNRQGQLQVYNPIYQAVFNPDWLTDQLAQLPPYGAAIAAWLASDRQDESRLLRGQALQDAQTWAADKSVGDADRLFLQASQTADQRDVELRLVAEQAAKQTLQAANRKARQRLWISSSVAAATLILASVAGGWANSARQDAVRAEARATDAATRTTDALAQEEAAIAATAAAEQNAAAANQAAQVATQAAQAANQERAQVSAELDDTLAVLADTQAAVDAATAQVTATEARASAAEMRAVRANQDAAMAQANLTQAQTELATTEQQLGLSREVGQLERLARSALRLFEAGIQEERQAGLLAALEVALDLDSLHKGTPSQSGDYPTIAPVFALQTALNNTLLSRVLEGHSDEVWSAQFHPTGTQVVTAAVDGTARVWNLNTGAVTVLEGHSDAVWDAQFDPTGTQVVTASSDETVRVWDLNMGEVRILQGHTDAVLRAQFDGAGMQVVTASLDGTARVWDLSTGEAIALQGHQASVVKAQFNAAGTQVVTASRDGTARVWDLSTGEAIALQGHTDSVEDAQFNPAGTQVVTASRDGTARIWDIETGESVVLEGHTLDVRAAEFNAEGTQVVTASEDGTARIWDI